MRPDWFSRWWRRAPDILTHDKPDQWPLPPEVRKQFDSFIDLGVRDVMVDGAVVRRVQLFECHICVDMTDCRATFAVENYDLAATLSSGQAFRWRGSGGAWEGVMAGRWVRLRQEPSGICAETAAPVADWQWLRHYLQLDVELAKSSRRFRRTNPCKMSVRRAAGLRLLRQEPWECLASFICSSTKQIVQIQQIIALLCRRFGEAGGGAGGPGTGLFLSRFRRGWRKLRSPACASANWGFARLICWPARGNCATARWI